MGYRQLNEKIVEVIGDGHSFTEKETLYLIVECWKLCERTNTINNYLFLRFFRNWCVHTKIDRLNNTVLSILKDSSLNEDEKLATLLEGLKEDVNKILNYWSIEIDFNHTSFQESLIEILTEQPVEFEVHKYSLIVDESTKVPVIWENLGTIKVPPEDL